MSSNPLPTRIARAFAVLRGLMLLAASGVLIVASEKLTPGSSSEPAHSLAAMVGSRTMIIGGALVVLAVRGQWRGLAWVLFADAILQLFDTGNALATHKGALAVLPAVIGALDAWAGMTLWRRVAIDSQRAVA